ncbi:FKBP-type peptidyl-prolyl cis-trans isomerase [Candidatus Pandoraea novymonadis]|uniref:peptidylprolyl isomerase n=1 Tax=Candidatus Pandoraea novymonadis TaxID=1808959 RepID=A0ABX5FDR0_9BURK|nr:peptidylprolyl isomerase [Candidatus Pandoraea novymonadis]PSB91840.1 FKBP-type 16 kDa peptidyl-prolyl cis-trans isomerase [Candidatus Pandoraea novymonadis]
MYSIVNSIIQENSYLTLHYRIATFDGSDIVNTFGGRPATLQLGTGQLIWTLEKMLLGLSIYPEPVHFELEPDAAFGMRNPKLLQWVSLKALKYNDNGNFLEDCTVGDLVEFNATNGVRYTGILREFGETACLLDFNHPLAGQRIVFEVQIIGIL